MNAAVIISVVSLVSIAFLLTILLCLIVRRQKAEVKIDVMSKEYEILLYQWVEEQTQKTTTKIQ
jgi:hypothetical protein